jgi:multidrug transporter EmrE-like cation transporter
MMGWILLALAVCLEALATFAAKYANGFTNLVPSIITIIAFILSFVALTFALNTVDMSLAYPVWTGGAVCLVAILGVMIFHETLNFFKVFSTLLVVFGVVGLIVSSQPAQATCSAADAAAGGNGRSPQLATAPIFNRGILPVLATARQLYYPNVISVKPEFSELG